jgi:hypothetical protein
MRSHETAGGQRVEQWQCRARHSLRRAVAQLIGEGLIAQGEGNQYPIQPTRISFTYPGGGTSAPVFRAQLAIGDESSTPRFLPIRSIRPRQGDVLLPAEEMLAGLDAILGRRGMDLVREPPGTAQRAVPGVVQPVGGHSLATRDPNPLISFGRAVLD